MEQSIGVRIKRARQRLADIENSRLSQAALAKRLGWSQTRLANYESDARTPGPGEVAVLAAALSVSPGWLMFGGDEQGELSWMIEPPARSQPRRDPNAVPLISWVRAGAWEAAADPYQPGDADEWLPCPAPHGPHTYALRVSGDSMTAPYGRSYPHGCVIYVDPAQSGGVSTGDPIIAKIDGEDGVTFKAFVEDGGRSYLKPLNPAYPLITDPFRVLGKVIGMYDGD